MAIASKTPKVFLIVLDGFGDGKDYPFNAIRNTEMPFYKSLARSFPRSQLLTCGEAVGLPEGVMGNSEVGHMNMGAGRIVYQELSRINKSIRDGDFFENEALKKAMTEAKAKSGRIHLMGLLSDAGVHSHFDHLKAMVSMASKYAPVTIHAFTDGRDTPPTSAEGYLTQLSEFLKSYPDAVLGSLSGRYYAMDRDNRWERVQKAWQAITGQCQKYSSETDNGCDAALQALKESHAKGTTDEFVVPVRFEPEKGRGFVADGDAVIFFNFRSDRARELSRCFTEDGFKEFPLGTRPKLADYVCLTEYDKKLKASVAYRPQNLSRIFPDLLAENGLKQFRIAETEKYAHVTFFFNCGREAPYAGEDRLLIPSPKDVATYDLKPEMSAFEVADGVASRLAKADCHFVLLNFANPDMVGHTGNYAAACKALAAVDTCLEKSVKAALGASYDVLITADHGNIEEMCDEHDQPHTQHTLNPVPFHYISNKFKFGVKDGILADLAPTMLQIMGIKQPEEMLGKSLLTGSR